MIRLAKQTQRNYVLPPTVLQIFQMDANLFYWIYIASLKEFIFFSEEDLGKLWKS